VEGSGANPAERCVAVRQSPVTEARPNASVNIGPASSNKSNTTSHTTMRGTFDLEAVVVNGVRVRGGIGYAQEYILMQHSPSLAFRQPLPMTAHADSHYQIQVPVPR
jgi:hypothetical protein